MCIISPVQVFSEKKGLNFFKDKTVRIRRVLDPERRNVLYISYSTRLSSAADEGVTSGRYKCVSASYCLGVLTLLLS